LALVGSNPDAPAVNGDELPGRVNYFLGNDPAQWRTNVPTYSSVTYQTVYPGVDLVYRGNAGHLESDFRVAPGADPNAITLSIDGADSVSVDGGGDLVLATAGGPLR